MPATPAGERRVDYLPLGEVPRARRNPKGHAAKVIAGSISQFGIGELPLLDERTGRLVAGHGRLDDLTARQAAGEDPPDGVRVADDGRWLVPVIRGWASRSDADADAYLLVSNRSTELGGWDDPGLADLLADLRDVDPDLLAIAGFGDDDLARLLETPGGGDGGGDGGGGGGGRPSLADQFLIPPFDVLDTRQGWWQDRKRMWLGLGIRSEIGRDGGLTFDSASSGDSDFYRKKNAAEKKLGRKLTAAEFEAQTPELAAAPYSSVFDPVLCELAYRWFSPADGVVVDPFAGGSVRGLLAAVLGRHYIGNDLSAAQVEQNGAQAAEFVERGLISVAPSWSVGDSADWVHTLPASSADLIFTCPPYYDLERYSDDPADLSRMSYADFDRAFAGILTGAAAALRPDRFAVIVVGDARDSRGVLHDLRGATVRAAEQAGLTFASGAVLINMVGSAAMRAARQFTATRTLCRLHQDVLIFVKGDRGRAATACGTVEVHLPDGVDAAGDGADDSLVSGP